MANYGYPYDEPIPDSRWQPTFKPVWEPGWQIIATKQDDQFYVLAGKVYGVAQDVSFGGTTTNTVTTEMRTWIQGVGPTYACALDAILCNNECPPELYETIEQLTASVDVLDD
jgi:hypothetical protein